jgi:cold shock CspA family protein
MPTRIYDIVKKLGLENKVVISKAKSLGIAAAKVPSSSLDKISAEWLEEELLKDHPEIAVKFAPPPPEHDLPNSNSTLRFEIKMSGSWSPAFMRQLQSRGINVEVVLVSEQDQTEKIRLNLIPDTAQNLDGKIKKAERVVLDEKTKTLLMAAYGAASANKVGEWVTLALFGDVVKKLNPDFKSFQVGASSLSELIKNVPEIFETRTDTTFPVPVIFLRPKSQTENVSAKRANGHIMSLHGGYGFIKPEIGENGLFFHASDVLEIKIESLKVGDSVSFIPGTNERGPCARAVRIISA